MFAGVSVTPTGKGKEHIEYVFTSKLFRRKYFDKQVTNGKTINCDKTFSHF